MGRLHGRRLGSDNGTATVSRSCLGADTVKNGFEVAAAVGVCPPLRSTRQRLCRGAELFVVMACHVNDANQRSLCRLWRAITVLGRGYFGARHHVFPNMNLRRGTSMSTRAHHMRVYTFGTVLRNKAPTINDPANRELNLIYAINLCFKLRTGMSSTQNVACPMYCSTSLHFKLSTDTPSTVYDTPRKP